MGDDDKNAIRAAIGTPTPNRLRPRRQALRLGMSEEEVHQGCKIDPWFIAHLKKIVDMEARVREHGLPEDEQNLRMLKAMGFSDARLASLTAKTAKEVAHLRNRLNVRPVYKRIDTCAAEFASPTAYMYSTYETPFAAPRAPKRKSRPARRSSSSAAAEPHRPGHRVRLLLLPCRLRAEGCRL